MAVTAHVYTKGILADLAKLSNQTSDTLKVMLLSAYTVGTTQDTAEFLSDVLAVATEASGTGYTAGGATLASVTVTTSGHVVTLAAANPSWNASGGSLAAAYAVLYDSTPGTNATDPLIAYVDFGGTQTASNATFTLTWNASGIVTYTGS